MASTLASIRERNQAGANPPEAGLFVIYNFPDRDCSAKASDGELHLDENGLERYKTEYIDPIVELVKEYSDIRMIFIHGNHSPGSIFELSLAFWTITKSCHVSAEPDGLANLITNMGVEKCAGAADAYTESTIYALSELDHENVAIYMDLAHAGWLGCI